MRAGLLLALWMCRTHASTTTTNTSQMPGASNHLRHASWLNIGTSCARPRRHRRPVLCCSTNSHSLPRVSGAVRIGWVVPTLSHSAPLGVGFASLRWIP